MKPPRKLQGPARLRAREEALDAWEQMFEVLSRAEAPADLTLDVLEDQLDDQEETLDDKWKDFFLKHSDRILFGSDAVAPTEEAYTNLLTLYDRIWRELPDDVVENVTWNNYQRLFDGARADVRVWEKEALARSSSPA